MRCARRARGGARHGGRAKIFALPQHKTEIDSHAMLALRLCCGIGHGRIIEAGVRRPKGAPGLALATRQGIYGLIAAILEPVGRVALPR